MKENEIVEGNKLIAEFMGLVRREPDKTYRLHQWYEPETDKRKRGRFMGYDDSLEYHESWEWIMKVVERLKGMNIDVMIYIIDGVTNVHVKPMVQGKTFYFQDEDPIYALWESITSFIKWYKPQTPKP